MDKMDGILQALFQMYLSMWADYDKEVDDDMIHFLKVNANATRNYLKATGRWVSSDN